jgi:hypothetical protein
MKLQTAGRVLRALEVRYEKQLRILYKKKKNFSITDLFKENEGCDGKD